MRLPRPRLRSRTGALTAGACALTAVAAPLAIAAGGGGIQGGARNPSPDASVSYHRETQIIASNSTYGTRQSNKSNNGGGAIYGCRSGAGGSPVGNEPCIRANNLRSGLAFEFQTNGAKAGTINTHDASGAPFTTNAHGVATGLNADQVDGKSASDFAAAGDLLWAAVGADGKATAGRGASAATLAGTAFTVTFTRDVSKCSYTATQNGAAAAPVVLSAASAGTAHPTQVIVDEASTSSTPLATPVPFHLQVIC